MYKDVMLSSETLLEVNGELDRRIEFVKNSDGFKFPKFDEETPYIRVKCDLDSVRLDNDDMSILDRIVRLGRSVGICVVGKRKSGMAL